MGLNIPESLLTPADREHAARLAMGQWGLAGVGVRDNDCWDGVILVAPSNGLPRQHPLSADGLSDDTAGVIFVQTALPSSALAADKRLCVGLSRHLRGLVTGIEAQAGATALTTPLAPSPAWLLRMGFRPLRYPLCRYRLDFSTLATWLESHRAWYPRPVVSLSGQAAAVQPGSPIARQVEPSHPSRPLSSG
jgi:hypothetical protein